MLRIISPVQVYQLTVVSARQLLKKYCCCYSIVSDWNNKQSVEKVLLLLFLLSKMIWSQ